METGAQRVEFSKPVRQIVLMVAVLVLVVTGGALLAAQIATVFLANPYLNGFIGLVFLLGVGATFWQVAQLMAATEWLRALQAGNKGQEIARPPRLVASIAPILREGRVSKRLAASTTRSILDSIAVRLDEARDITRYIASLLIFLGLLGTFWGLSNTVPAVVDTIRSLAPADGADGTDAGVFSRLMTGLEAQLGGMGTAFASSLMGLAGSLIVGLLELFASHGQNRFYRELEEWLASFTRLGLVSEGEGPDGALVALLERVDEGLERTAESASKAESARVAAEDRLGQAAEVVMAIAGQIERDQAAISQLMTEIREARESEASRTAAILTALKRIEQANGQIASALSAGAVGGGANGAGHAMNGEAQAYLRNLDAQLGRIAADLSTGRHETTTALRTELRTLINLIDARTRQDEVR